MCILQSVLQYGFLGRGGTSYTVLELVPVTQRLIIKAVFKKGNTYPTFLLFQVYSVENVFFFV